MARKKKNLKHPAEIGEAVTLAVSIIIFTALVGYLLYNLKNDPSDILQITAEPGTAAPIPDSDNYIMPVTIKNNGLKTISHLEMDVTLADQSDQSITVSIDYLSRQSSRDIFLITDRPYAREEIDIQPNYYKFE